MTRELGNKEGWQFGNKEAQNVKENFLEIGLPY
jgi:hypothetical protein